MPVKDANVRGWVFYDAECRLCVRGVRRWGGLFARRGFVWVPLQTPGAAAQLGIPEGRLWEEMWLRMADGRVVSGVASWSEMLRAVWWLWPLGVLLGLPGIRYFARFVYRWIARNRYCFGGRCAIHAHRANGFGAVEILFFGLIVGLVIVLARGWPPWIFMWTLGVTLGEFGKWLTWRDARRVGLPTLVGRTLAWFLLWLGMDGRAFFDVRCKASKGSRREWLAAIFKLALGITLIWGIAPRIDEGEPLVRGWCAMIGIVFLLHFGFFHLLSLVMRQWGLPADPIMNRPLAATSLAQFWSERWNTAFSIPSRRFLFQPLARRIGIRAASLAVFAASGVLHELVISVPARGGYGLPTAYFLLQGAGVWFERSMLGNALRLGTGWRGWLFTMMLAAGPAFWLFHPPFVHNVILPMLEAIGGR